MAKRPKGGKRAGEKATRGRGAGLTAADPGGEALEALEVRDEGPALEGLTGSDLEQATRDLVDRVNEVVGALGKAHDRLSLYLFRVLFGTNVKAALNPDKQGTRAYVRLSERAGHSLDLSSKQLSYHVRIGALNYRARDDGWTNLDWWKKVELLPLLAHEERWKKLAAGVRKANDANVGLLVLRRWVQVAMGKRGPGEEQPLSLPQGRALVGYGHRLDERESRAEFVQKVRGLEPDRRRELVKGLRETAKNLELLVDEIEEDDE